MRSKNYISFIAHLGSKIFADSKYIWRGDSKLSTCVWTYTNLVASITFRPSNLIVVGEIRVTGCVYSTENIAIPVNAFSWSKSPSELDEMTESNKSHTIATGPSTWNWQLPFWKFLLNEPRRMESVGPLARPKRELARRSKWIGPDPSVTGTWKKHLNTWRSKTCPRC